MLYPTELRAPYLFLSLTRCVLKNSALDNLSNEAVLWVLARELGRVLSEPNWSWRRKGSATSTQDEAAEALALEWGFSSERDRFEQEYILSKDMVGSAISA